MIKNFIFDIDGTLLDSNDFHAQAWVEAFAAYGKTIPFKRVRPCMGEGADQLLPEFLDKKEVKEIGQDLSKLCGEIFRQKYFPKVRPFLKVRALFKKIRQSGARIALASSADTGEVKKHEKKSHTFKIWWNIPRRQMMPINLNLLRIFFMLS
jgi:phosphoglycolate phosphatase-like HAD superfamily hydrolase